MSELKQVSMGRDKAIELAETGWWRVSTPEAIFKRQMLVRELIGDFSAFHEATEKVLGRPVWTHEFARPQLLWDEYEGRRVVTNPLETSLEVLTEIMGPSGEATSGER
jgi:hypothetical protein